MTLALVTAYMCVALCAVLRSWCAHHSGMSGAADVHLGWAVGCRQGVGVWSDAHDQACCGRACHSWRADCARMCTTTAAGMAWLCTGA
ncbi:hypothetical protein COO60DRAFT_1533627 [Scenedesmus sp. NREL 46B-D3]|nr:hypothetical protein COO60DRAFT_1533627 [Scenedesmus sp. NREL 46B-D3]